MDTDLNAALTAKVAAMTASERSTRIYEIDDKPGQMTDDETLEFAKLLFSPSERVWTVPYAQEAGGTRRRRGFGS